MCIVVNMYVNGSLFAHANQMHHCTQQSWHEQLNNARPEPDFIRAQIFALLSWYTWGSKIELKENFFFSFCIACKGPSIYTILALISSIYAPKFLLRIRKNFCPN